MVVVSLRMVFPRTTQWSARVQWINQQQQEEQAQQQQQRWTRACWDLQARNSRLRRLHSVELERSSQQLDHRQTRLTVQIRVFNSRNNASIRSLCCLKINSIRCTTILLRRHLHLSMTLRVQSAERMQLQCTSTIHRFRYFLRVRSKISMNIKGTSLH